MDTRMFLGNIFILGKLGFHNICSPTTINTKLDSLWSRYQVTRTPKVTKLATSKLARVYNGDSIWVKRWMQIAQLGQGDCGWKQWCGYNGPAHKWDGGRVWIVYSVDIVEVHLDCCTHCTYCRHCRHGGNRMACPAPKRDVDNALKPWGPPPYLFAWQPSIYC